MPLQGGPYNVDWIFSNNSNVHVCKDKEWFFNYTPFRTRTTSYMGGGTDAIGVGDVQLETNTPTSERNGGVKGYATLVLREVLHCPGGVCNIFGLGAVLKESGGGWRSTNTELEDVNARVRYCLDSSRLMKLWLVGQPKGQSSLEAGTAYFINATWADEERARLRALKSGGGSAAAGAAAMTSNGTHAGAASGRVTNGASVREYTEAEKRWLKEHYGNEFKFLMTHGLKMHDEEDREEGRQIARALMTEDE